jgi:hypothetical protein
MKRLSAKLKKANLEASDKKKAQNMAKRLASLSELILYNFYTSQHPVLKSCLNNP